MIPDIETAQFIRLLELEKRCDESTLNLPTTGEQARYNITALFEPDERFIALMNRKGHIQRNNLTLIMRSKSSGVMMRYDIVGADHNWVPTPHLHVFDAQHHNGRVVIAGADLGDLRLDASSPENLIHALAWFLLYNRVTLTGVAINGTAL
ncbi:DUF6978 family protein [Lacticaseibacillus parakribbianus]|uniref:DUF6978 family protein n=1 Tax=Lacticaseibacillus parakribbianus TaxID=2970927 RepID=UPI0021CB1015|nr:hypothetical protein [Lacticaseibacillus parakribbianus]